MKEKSVGFLSGLNPIELIAADHLLLLPWTRLPLTLGPRIVALPVGLEVGLTPPRVGNGGARISVD